MNAKTLKRILALTAAGVMITSSLTGCGNNEQTSTKNTETTVSESSASTESQEVVEVKEPTKLTYWAELDGNAASVITNLGELEFIQVLEEKANVDITFNHPASGAAKEQFNLKMASKEYEDLIEYSWGSYPGGGTQAIDDGVIIDLAPYIEEYAPNFAKYLEENPDMARQCISEDGRIFAFPCFGSPEVSVTKGFVVRKDWLDKLNMEVPTTVAEWEDVLVAFKEQLGVEKPFTYKSSDFLLMSSYWGNAYGINYSYYVVDGKVTHGLLEAGYKDFMTMLSDWYDRGLIDNDVWGNDGKIMNSNVLNGISGATYGGVGGAIGTLMQTAVDPEMELVGAPVPVMNEGDQIEFVPRSADLRAGGQVAISTACEDIEAAMRYCDLYYTEEGVLLKNFGIEGVSYTMENGTPTYTDLILNNPDGLAIGNALGKYTRASSPSIGLIDVDYYMGYYELESQLEALEMWNDGADYYLTQHAYMPTSVAAADSEELAQIESALNTYMAENLALFINGDRSMTEWDAFVAELKAMGIERAIEIKQAAYDAYMAR